MKSDIIKLVNFSGDLVEFYTSSKKICPQCGYEFADYARTGVLGCSKCYDTFHDEIKSQVLNGFK